MTIEEFIAARIADDEQIARGAAKAGGTDWDWDIDQSGAPTDGIRYGVFDQAGHERVACIYEGEYDSGVLSRHIARHDPGPRFSCRGLSRVELEISNRTAYPRIMADQQCATCSRSTDMFICWDCCKTLRTILGTAAWVAKELEVTLTRQDQIGEAGNGGRRSAEVPLPFHLAASEAGWVLRNTLTTWARDLCETRSMDYPGETSTSGVARWLAHNSIAIALSEGAGEAFDEIDAAVKSAQRVIDRPPGRLYIGPCGAELNGIPCEADLYVTMGNHEARCPVCGYTHLVEERRDQLRDQVRGLLGTAAELSRLLPWIMGSPITRKRITYYANKGMISRREHMGETVYQIGEVIAAHIQCEARRAA